MGKKVTVGKELTELVKAIGECKSKSEEDMIIRREVEVLTVRIKAPKIDKALMKEYLIRMAYIEMLGHDASGIGYVHAVNFTNETNLLYKKVGYLASTLFLNERNELLLLLVGTIQKDLVSDNYLAVASALTATCKLIAAEHVSSVLDKVVKLLTHPKELVRKKAVMALHRFHLIAPSSVAHLKDQFRAVLCDKDVSVLSAALCALHDLLKEDPSSYKNLVPSFVSVLKQVADRRLPKGYDYHKCPAPFIQIKILRILALLGAADKAHSEQMYEVLSHVLKCGASTKGAIGHAVVFECVRTVTSIYPYIPLLQTCSEMLTKFLQSNSANLRYAGVSALGNVVKINHAYGNEYQMAVVNCLESTDDSLKKKTLELLCKMTTPDNVEVIVAKMIEFLKGVSDPHVKTEICTMVAELAESFAPTNRWFVGTMNEVFALGGEHVKSERAHTLMRLIAEGCEDEEDDEALRVSAVESYLGLLAKPKLPEVLLKVICWVLGEYGGLAPSHTPDDVARALCGVAGRQAVGDDVKGYVLSAVGKLAASSGGALVPEAEELIRAYASSRNADLQQRAHELQNLLAGPPAALAVALPFDASCEDIEVDPSLSFLQGYVDAALARGAAPYSPPDDGLGLDTGAGVGGAGGEHGAGASGSGGGGGLRFEAYEQAPLQPPPVAAAAAGATAGGGEAGGSGAGGAATFEPRLNTTGPRKWGRHHALPTGAAAEGAPHDAAAAGDAGGTEMDDAALAAKLQAEWDAEAAAQGYDLQAEAKMMVGGAASIQHSEVSARPARAAEPPSEKEMMAASLFGGGGGGGGARAAPRARGAAAARPRPVAAAAPAAPAPAPVADLLDLGDATPASAPPPAAGDPLSELEGLLVGGGGAPPPEAAPPAEAPKPAIDIDSLYGAPPAAGGIAGLAPGAVGGPAAAPGMGMGMAPGMMMPGYGMAPGMMMPPGGMIPGIMPPGGMMGMGGMGGMGRPPGGGMGRGVGMPPPAAQRPPGAGVPMAAPAGTPPPPPADDPFKDLLM